MKRKIILSVLVIMLICGIALISYPTISNIINNYTNYSFINRYNKSVQSLSKQQKKDYLVKAYEYNQMVRTEFYPATIQKSFLKFLNHTTIL